MLLSTLAEDMSFITVVAIFLLAIDCIGLVVGILAMACLEGTLTADGKFRNALNEAECTRQMTTLSSLFRLGDYL